MNELSLFTGAGGGILGTHLLGWTPIGYVEWDDYCQRVLAARIRDGYIPSAPIFGDVRKFVESGAAEQYRGFADVVTAGFPCQPFSVAGKQLAADDHRNMWPATEAVIRVVRPDHVLLENVPGLLFCGYAGVVLAGLAALGYVGRWGCLSAADAGAPHERERWWVVAHANDKGIGRRKQQSHGCSSQREMAHADRSQRKGGRISSGVHQEYTDFGRGRWWQAEPDVGRVANGMASWMDRLRAIGNGQVPVVAATAWETLA